jgi:hypothetical protein
LPHGLCVLQLSLTLASKGETSPAEDFFVYYPLLGTGSGFPSTSHVRLEKPTFVISPEESGSFIYQKPAFFVYRSKKWIKLKIKDIFLA